MKNKIFILLLFVSVGFSSCVKNTIENTVEVTIDKTSIWAGESVTYTIKGDVEHLAYYGAKQPGGTGVLDHAYIYTGKPVYGSGDSIPVTGSDLNLKDIKESNDLYVDMYNSQGVFPITFIASSYSNWGTEQKQTITTFNLTVEDRRTGIIDCKLKVGSLGNFEYFDAVVYSEESKIVGYVPLDMRAKLIVDLTLESPFSALTYEDGSPMKNAKPQDLTSGSLKFNVTAPNADIILWTLGCVEPAK